MEKETVNEAMSLSKQRKQSRKEEIARKKKQAVINRVIWIAVAVVVVGLIAWGAIRAEIKKANSVTADSNYSAQLKDDGTIKGVKASEYINIPDYRNITAALSDIEYSDESIDADIESVLESNMYISDSTDIAAADGDEVNIDYVGSIDGVEFEGGAAEGYDLVLGSNSFIDDFEAQIEGHIAGDEFDVEVTFPDEYSNNPDLAGCDAVFKVKLNGIYVKPEFTDEFVAEKLSDYATTVEEYRQYLKDTNYESNLTAYIQDYLVDNSTLIKTPGKYQKQLKANYKAYEYSNFQYMNSMYSTYYGYTPYETFEDYITEYYSMTEAEYDASLGDKVDEEMRYILACLTIAEKEGITATTEEAHEHFIAEGGTEENYETMIETYGAGYLTQQLLCEKVIDGIYGTVTVK